MTREEYDKLVEPIWGETKILQEVIDRSFDNISDEDFEFLKDWFGVFAGTRGRDIDIIENKEIIREEPKLPE